MKMQYSLLSLAVVAGLAVAGSADAAAPTKAAAVNRALSIVGTSPVAMRRAGGDAFAARDVIVDADGTEHVRFHRTFGGLPVIGGDMVVHSRNGKLAGVSQTLRSSARPSLKPTVSADQAIVEAGARFGSHFQGAPNSRLVVYALGASPVLAHEVVFSGVKADQTPTEMHYFVDARSGKLLNQWDEIHVAKPGPGGSTCAGTAATGSGKTLMIGNVAITTTKCSATSYELRDPTRGGGYTTNMAMKTAGLGTVFTDSDNVWGNNLTSNSQTAAADAQWSSRADLISAGTTAAIFSQSSGWPITPVEAMKTSLRGRARAWAMARVLSSTALSPSLPVKALALPALATMARTLPRGRFLRHQSTGAEQVFDRVSTPAIVAPAGTTASITSSRSL